MAVLSMYYGKIAPFGFVRDITFDKKLQEMLFSSQKLAAIGKLSAEPAHEINDPLTSVPAFNKLIEEILKVQPFQIDRLREIEDYTPFISGELNRCMDIARNLPHLDWKRLTREFLHK